MDILYVSAKELIDSGVERRVGISSLSEISYFVVRLLILRSPLECQKEKSWFFKTSAFYMPDGSQKYNEKGNPRVFYSLVHQLRWNVNWNCLLNNWVFVSLNSFNHQFEQESLRVTEKVDIIAGGDILCWFVEIPNLVFRLLLVEHVEVEKTNSSSKCGLVVFVVFTRDGEVLFQSNRWSLFKTQTIRNCLTIGSNATTKWEVNLSGTGEVLPTLSTFLSIYRV